MKEQGIRNKDLGVSMRQRLSKLVLCSLLLFTFHLSPFSPQQPEIVHAADCADGFTEIGRNQFDEPICREDQTNTGTCVSEGGFLGLPHWYKYLDCDEDGTIIIGAEVQKDASGNLIYDDIVNDDGEVIGQKLRLIEGGNINGLLPIGFAVTEILLRIVVYATIIFIVIGGIRLISSAGNSEGVANARKTITNAIVGMALAILATRIVTFVGSRLYRNTFGSGAITNFVDFLVQVGVGIAVLFIVLGGLRYVASQGDPQKIEGAKNTILFAVIGLIVMLSAYTIVSFVGGRL